MGQSVTDQIADKQAELMSNLAKADTNKAAARRARKNTLELEKLYKTFRKDSLK